MVALNLSPHINPAIIMAEAIIPTQVSNMDIAGICDRIAMYAIEVQNCQSSLQGGVFLPYDMARTASYLDRLDECIDAFNKTPMDLPKSSNYTFSVLKPFPGDPDLENVENQDIKDVLRRFKSLWLEAANSQSADLSSGIIDADVSRLQAVLNSCRDVLNLAKNIMDLPENPSNVPAPVGTNGERSASRTNSRRFG